MNEAAQASQGRSEMQDGSPVGSLAITSFSFLFSSVQMAICPSHCMYTMINHVEVGPWWCGFMYSLDILCSVTENII